MVNWIQNLFFGMVFDLIIKNHIKNKEKLHSTKARFKIPMQGAQAQAQAQGAQAQDQGPMIRSITLSRSAQWQKVIAASRRGHTAVSI